MVGFRQIGSSPGEETLVALELGPKGTVPPVTHVRGTLIAASLLSLRSRGHFDAYLRHLPEPFHAPILHSVAGSWLDISLGVAHYRAAEELQLPSEELIEIGRGVAAKIQQSLLGTLVRLAKTAGVTPWLGLEYVPTLWARCFIGGSIAVYRRGPKEARFEAHGNPELAALGYFRNAFRGMFLGSGELFCSKVYIHDMPSLAEKGIVGFRIAWA